MRPTESDIKRAMADQLKSLGSSMYGKGMSIAKDDDLGRVIDFYYESLIGPVLARLDHPSNNKFGPQTADNGDIVERQRELRQKLFERGMC